MAFPTDTVSPCLTPHQVVFSALLDCTSAATCAEVFLCQCLPLFGARAGVIALLRPGGEYLDIIASRGYSEELMARWQTFSLSAPTPMAEVVHTGDPIFIGSRDKMAVLYPHLSIDPQCVHDEARAAIPLVTHEGRMIGAVGLSFTNPRTFDEGERSFFLEVVQQGALSLERMQSDDPLRSIVVAGDITEAERRRAESIRLSLALESTGMGTWDLDMTTGTVHLAESCCALFGRRGPSVGDIADHADWFHPEDLGCFTQALVEAADRLSGTIQCEVRALWPDGTVRWHEISGRLLRDAVGRPARVVGVARDITDIKEAAGALQRVERERSESEERFRILADTAPALVWMADTDGRGYWFNQAWLSFTGRCMAEELGDGWAEGVHPDDLSRCLDTYRDAFGRYEPFQMEYRLRRHDGAYRWLFDSGAPRFNAGGEFVGYIGSCIDVTERRQAEEERDVALARLRGVIDSAMDAIVSVDEEFRIIVFNAAAERIFGVPAQEVIGSPLERFLPERSRGGHAARVHEFGRSGVTRRNLGHLGALYAKRADGTEFPIEAAAIAQVAVGGERVYTAVVRDLTEQIETERARREADEALRLSEYRYRALVEATSQIVWTSNADGTVDYLAQHGWTAFTGQTEEHMRTTGWLDAIHPDDREATTRAWTQAEEDGSTFDTVYRLRRHDGVYRHMAVRGVPVRNDDGTVREWVGTHTDVTDQQNAAHQQRQFLRDVLFSVTEGRLHLCENESDLPPPLPQSVEEGPIALSTSSLRSVRRIVQEAAQAQGFEVDRWQGLMSAASECAMNAVQHGGGAAEAHIYTDDHQRMQVWVTDRGQGIDVASLPQATLMKGYSGGGGFGHGFFLMLQYVDAVYLLTGPQGTTVVLEQAREAPLPFWAN